MFRLNSEPGLIARHLNYLDAQAEAPDGLPPDRYRPLLEESQWEAERVEAEAERTGWGGGALPIHQPEFNQN